VWNAKVVDYGGSTLKSAGNAQQRNSILLALKNSYKLEIFFRRNECAVQPFLDGIMKPFNPNNSK
jgi:hypothetical protein